MDVTAFKQQKEYRKWENSVITTMNNNNYNNNRKR